MIARVKGILCVVALGVVSVGCSSSGSITDLTTSMPTMGTQVGFVPGSKQNVTTSQGYTVSSSVGNWTEGIRQTTSQGYVVYGSVQGNMVSTSADLVLDQ
jgi:pyridoxine 5'-phosphate synthase PdxJ